MPQPDHLEWHRTTVQGRSAFYGEAGEGPTVVFLHGWALGHHTYKRVAKRLVRDLGLRVVAPSLPGFGGTSDLPKADFTLHGYGRWVLDFLAAIEIDEPVYLVGHSFGGGVAICAAHEDAAAVRFLVLVNSIGGSKWSTDKAMRDRPLWDWGLHFPTDLLHKQGFRTVLPVVLEDAVFNVIRNPLALMKVGNLARTADLTAELADLRVRRLPVLVLWGDQDKIITEAAFRDLCLAIGTEGHVIGGAHSWLLADPDAFGQVMTNVIEVARVASETERAEAS